MRIDVHKNPSSTDIRNFGLTMPAAFGVLGVVFYWRAGWTWTGSALQWIAIGMWTLGLAIGSVALARPAAGRVIYVKWMGFAAAIGRVMMPVFFTVAYFTLLPPFSLIRFSDPLRMRLKRQGSYWEPHRHHDATLERMRRPF